MVLLGPGEIEFASANPANASIRAGVTTRPQSIVLPSRCE